MVKFYALQIQLGKITVDDVPVRYREAVGTIAPLVTSTETAVI